MISHLHINVKAQNGWTLPLPGAGHQLYLYAHASKRGLRTPSNPRHLENSPGHVLFTDQLVKNSNLCSQLIGWIDHLLPLAYGIKYVRPIHTCRQLQPRISFTTHRYMLQCAL